MSDRGRWKAGILFTMAISFSSHGKAGPFQWERPNRSLLQDDMARLSRWQEQVFAQKGKDLPISFSLDGASSRSLLYQWGCDANELPAPGPSSPVLTHTDPKSGIVQAFWREGCEESLRVFKLSGLEERAAYRIESWDAPGDMIRTGKALMEEGLGRCAVLIGPLYCAYEPSIPPHPLASDAGRQLHADTRSPRTCTLWPDPE